jgi:hypothetical protein
LILLKNHLGGRVFLGFFLNLEGETGKNGPEMGVKWERKQRIYFEKSPKTARFRR